MIVTPITSPADAVLLDARGVARLLGISERHVCRLRDRDAMPRPVRLGRAVRWDRRAVLDWVAAGCPESACVANVVNPR